MTKTKQTFTKRQLQAMPKVVTHEHLDCSVRPSTILDIAGQIGFDKFELPFPRDIITALDSAGTNKRARNRAARQYQQYMAGFARESLANYVQAVVHHILPVMQTQEHLYRITCERVDDAIRDGIIAMKLRFAPQLHLQQGLSLNEVMEPVIEAASQSCIPVRLIICALRHENGRMARRLADLAVRHNRWVTHFDLAGDEAAFPGVPLWWMKQAQRAAAGGVEPTCHIWETNEPTRTDVRRLKRLGVRVLGHGWRGDQQDGFVCTCCLFSYLTTGQIKHLREHNIDRLYRRGQPLTVDPDGLTFTGATLTDNYAGIHRTFGWGDAQFHRANTTAVQYSRFPEDIKARLQKRIDDGYPNRGSQ